MNLRGTDRSTRVEPVSHYHLIIYFFFGKNTKKRGRKRFEAVDRSTPRFRVDCQYLIKKLYLNRNLNLNP